MAPNIHKYQPVLKVGSSLQEADLAVILLHGRGATAESMLSIAKPLQIPGIHFIIPQAALNRWYPNSAFGPLEANEPDLSSAIKTIKDLVDELQEQGFAPQQIAFGGFSQGACLAAEYVARTANQYAGLFVFSGALIGPPGMERHYSGSFEQMPVFIGGSDVDPWVDHDLMKETAEVFERMGADVDFRTYTGMAHTINEDEITAVQNLLKETIKSYQVET
jgi:predicted esterase